MFKIEKVMKRLIVTALVLIVLMACGCGAKTTKMPDQFIDKYLTAVKNEDYEAIWNMLPKEVQSYAINEGIINDEKDGLDYIAFAVNDYYWLKGLDLPSCKKYEFEVDEDNKIESASAEQFLKSMSINLRVDDARYVTFSVTADGHNKQDAAMFMFSSNGKWYIASVVGDDEIFVY